MKRSSHNGFLISSIIDEDKNTNQPPRKKQKEEQSSMQEQQLFTKRGLVRQRKTPTTSWTPEEDEFLRKAAENRELKWDQIAKQIFNGKYTGSQCNQHWNRVLKDGIKKEPWTPNEDTKLYEAVIISEEVSWVDIKKQLPGRTDIQCRGRWQTLMKRFPNGLPPLPQRAPMYEPILIQDLFKEMEPYPDIHVKEPVVVQSEPITVASQESLVGNDSMLSQVTDSQLAALPKSSNAFSIVHFESQSQEESVKPVAATLFDEDTSINIS